MTTGSGRAETTHRDSLCVGQPSHSDRLGDQDWSSSAPSTMVERCTTTGLSRKRKAASRLYSVYNVSPSGDEIARVRHAVAPRGGVLHPRAEAGANLIRRDRSWR